jgi:hypothetical protein
MLKAAALRPGWFNAACTFGCLYRFLPINTVLNATAPNHNAKTGTPSCRCCRLTAQHHMQTGQLIKSTRELWNVSKILCTCEP